MSFQGKTVWITGAGSGLGKAMTLAFAKQGANLALSGRRADRLALVAEEASQWDCQTLVVPCDVTDLEELENAVQLIIEEYGQMDVSIANAGFAVNGTVEQLEGKDWEKQFAVNVVGLANTVKVALPNLRKSEGRMVLIGSVAAWFPASRSVAYCASKATVHAIGQAISAELHGSKTSCTTIHPGFVESEIAQVDNDGVFDASRKDRRPKQLMWTSERAATVMLKAIHKRKRTFVFTFHGKFIVWIARFFPGVCFYLMRKFG
jgi:short-subunit dehydrogenase